MPDSSTTEPKMSGGQSTLPPDSSLDQPKDALPLKDLPQSTPEAEISSKTDELKSQSTNTGDKETPAITPDMSSIQTDPTIQPISKGKEKENVQPPLPTKVPQDAIGPAAEEVQPISPLSATDGPVCMITLLLTSGARHPYKIDEKYLGKRNVSVPGVTDSGKKDPFSISVYTLKELILREWREEWEAKPSSPSSIRLIHFGKLLDDKEQLKRKPDSIFLV
jgi:hypothetical protein